MHYSTTSSSSSQRLPTRSKPRVSPNTAVLSKTIFKIRTAQPAKPPKIFALPPEILDAIIALAIPERTSTVTSEKLVPLSTWTAIAKKKAACTCCDNPPVWFPGEAGRPALRLALVHRRFWEAVNEAVYRRRPLRVVVWNEALDGAMNACPLKSGDLGPGLYEIKNALEEYDAQRGGRMDTLGRVPLHMFREIQVTLVPQLRPLGVPVELEGYFFPCVLRGEGNDVLWGGQHIRCKWRRLVNWGSTSLTNEARMIGRMLKDSCEVRGAVTKRETRVRVRFEDEDEEWRSELGKSQGSSLPTSWTRFGAENSMAEVVEGERLSSWTTDFLLGVLRAYHWVYDQEAGCAVRSLFQTVRFPSFTFEHRDKGMAPVDVHTYLRRKMVRMWQGESDSSEDELWAFAFRPAQSNDDGRNTKRMLVKNLERRLLPSDTAPLAGQVKDCGNCQPCKSEDFVWNQPRTTFCEDAYHIEHEDSRQVQEFHEQLEDCFLNLMQLEWPQHLAIEYEALLYNLIDIQVEVLRRALPIPDPERNNDSLRRYKNATLDAQQSLMKLSKSTINNCIATLSQPNSNEWKQEEMAKVLRDLPGGFNKDAVRRRLGWCHTVCGHPTHWANNREQARPLAQKLATMSVHPAWIPVIVDRIQSFDNLEEVSAAARRVGVDMGF